jgi:rhamnosyltransferase
MSSFTALQPANSQNNARRIVESSVLILTYNGEKYLPQSLDMLRRQKQNPGEIIAIDSGSTDRTLEILADHNVQIHKIPNSEFSHSKTRNLAAKLATGKYVVFLTQDATPADSCWLGQLLRPFKNHESVAAVYSRQIPRPGANPLEANDLRIGFPAERKIKTLPAEGFTKKNVWQLIHFSNASAAYSRELLLQHPFRADLQMGEDQEWVMRMLQYGYSFLYEPDSLALHSHDFTVPERRMRDFQLGKTFAQFLSPLLGPRKLPLGAFLHHCYLDIGYMAHHHSFSWKWALRFPIHRFTTHYAYYKGWNSNFEDNWRRGRDSNPRSEF